MPSTAPLKPLFSLGQLLALATLIAGATAAPTVVVNAGASLAGGIGPITEVRATTTAPYAFSATGLAGGAKAEVAFTIHAILNRQDRNLFMAVHLVTG